MGNVLFVVWRESLEAVLIVGILHSFLTRRQGVLVKRAVKAMWFGVAAGLALSILLAYSTVFVQDQLQGRALDWFQAVVMLISAGLMTQMVMWMNRNGRKLKHVLETEIQEAMSTSGVWGAGLVAMFAVAREGSETVVYLYGLALENRGVTGAWPLAGAAVLGIALALFTAFAVARGIRFLSYPTFFKVTSYALLFSAAGLVTSGVAKLIEMDILPSLVDPVWNTTWLLDSSHGAGAFFSTLTGYRARPALMMVIAYAIFWCVGLGLMNRSLWWPSAPGKSIEQKKESIQMNSRSLRKTVVLMLVSLASAGALSSRSARADIEYQELEVYTHQMDGEGSKEFESLTSFSNNVKGSDTGVFRSSMEFEYGVTNNFQLAMYTDFDNEASDNGFNFTELRVRGRYSFFEQNQLPVDIGAYVELAFPRYEDNKMEGELRLIVSKDVDRFTFSVNPTIERPLVVQNGASTDLEWGVSTSVAYRVDNNWLPHLDVFGALGEDEVADDGSTISTNQLMLVPAVDYRVSRSLAVGARVGFGLTDATERNLAAVRLEYEL